VGFPELEQDISSPAGAQAAESLGAVLEGIRTHPLQPVLLQLAPVALPLYKFLFSVKTHNFQVEIFQRSALAFDGSGSGSGSA